MASSVLAHVAGPFPQKENLATEALSFIANRSAQARRVIADGVALLASRTVNITRVDTQVVLGKESRPDLVLRGSDGAPVAFIEAKFWAALTESQPVEYLRRLEANGGGVLLFLAPERRLPSLRAEVRTRCQMVSGVAFGEDATLGVFRFGTSTLGFVSWDQLLGRLSRAVADDPAVSSDVLQLRGLCAQFEADGFVPLTRADIDNLESPRQSLALAELGEALVERAVEAGLLSTKGLRPRSDRYGIGRYVAFRRAGCWLGLSHWLWAKHGISPLWARFSPNDWGRADMVQHALRSFEVHEPPLVYRADDGWLQVPIVIATGVEKSVVVEAAVDQLRQIDGMMALANVPPLRSDANPDE